MDAFERQALMNEAQPVEDLFLAEVESSDCAGTLAAIQSLCALANPGQGTELDEVIDFSTGVCLVRFRCDIEYVNSDAILGEIPDVISVDHEGSMVVEALPAYGSFWGLNRIDQPDLPLSGTSFRTGPTGAGVNVYVIDTGINPTHEQFGGRASIGGDFVGESNLDDGHGHGTHCAGTAVGASSGVARDANVIGVKVLSSRGAGSSSGVAKGVQWAIDNQRKNFGNQAAVLSMSLGGKKNTHVNLAVTQAYAAGHIVVVAAGNDNDDACNYSPASTGGYGRFGGVITVGSSDIRDNRSGFSNHGECVDIYAPGSGILSSWVGGNAAYKSISGTSMATPHVAGVAATMLQKHNFDRNAAQKELLGISAVGKLSNLLSVNNELLQTTPDVNPPVTPSQPPTRPARLPPPVLNLAGTDFYVRTLYEAKFAPGTVPNGVRGNLAITYDPCGPWAPGQFEGLIVMVERGECLFHTKGKGLEAAGAVGVIVTQNAGKDVMFRPEYYGSEPDISVPLAFVTFEDAQTLSRLVARGDFEWGIDPKLLGGEGGSAGGQGIQNEPNFDKYFKPNLVGTGAVMCAADTDEQFIKKRASAQTAEECAIECINHSKCSHINFRAGNEHTVKCQVLRKCDVQDNSATDYVAYEYIWPKATPTPTVQGMSDYQVYFANNKDPTLKCQTNAPRRVIAQGLILTIEECATECMQLDECIFMNYNDIDGKCDLINICFKGTSEKVRAYEKVSPVEGQNITVNEAIFDTYFGANRIVSDDDTACGETTGDMVLVYQLDLTLDDCAAKCVSEQACTHINYDNERKGPCTLLKKCVRMALSPGVSTLVSYAKRDSTNSNETDDEYNTETTSSLNVGASIGFFVLGTVTFALAQKGYSVLVANKTHDYLPPTTHTKSKSTSTCCLNL